MRLAKEDEVLRPALYGGIAFFCAACGFGLLVSAMHIRSRLLLLVGVLLVVSGVTGGLMALIWGWLSFFRRKQKSG
jgi:hypothetical protein